MVAEESMKTIRTQYVGIEIDLNIGHIEPSVCASPHV